MYKIVAILLMTVFLTFPAAICLADESQDHVCCRVLDSDKDGIVTFEEFAKSYGNDKEKFNEADLDKDGKLTHGEYHSILGHGSS